MSLGGSSVFSVPFVISSMRNVTEADTSEFQLRGWEREQIILVILAVAEGDESFMAAAVVPLQPLVAQAMGHQFIQDAFQVLVLFRGEILVIIVLGGEEIGGRKLLRVSDDDQLPITGDGTHGVPHRDLGGFVKDYDIKGLV